MTFVPLDPPPNWDDVNGELLHARDPSTETWREAVDQSVSERLLQTQRDFAASQEDLTRMEAERDQFIAAADKLHGEWLDLKAELAKLRDGCAWRGLAEEAMRERETLRIQLAATYQFASAYQPGEHSWQVARQDTGIDCASCDRPIVRGQAFQPLADAAGQFAHCFCPDVKEA